jgi:hypothetical protein
VLASALNTGIIMYALDIHRIDRRFPLYVTRDEQIGSILVVNGGVWVARKHHKLSFSGGLFFADVAKLIDTMQDLIGYNLKQKYNETRTRLFGSKH